jgi:SPP1 family predicted phage head-tail adaptor
MEIGRLRHRVTIERATDAANSMGEPIQTWATLATVWASVEPTAGNEKFASMQVQGEVDTRIVCRYQDALATLAINDRVVFNSINFDIKSVLNKDWRNRQLEIFAKQHI